MAKTNPRICSNYTWVEQYELGNIFSLSRMIFTLLLLRATTIWKGGSRESVKMNGNLLLSFVNWILREIKAIFFLFFKRGAARSDIIVLVLSELIQLFNIARFFFPLFIIDISSGVTDLINGKQVCTDIYPTYGFCRWRRDPKFHISRRYIV